MQWNQAFAPQILQEIKPNQRAKFSISVPDEMRRGAQKLRLRWVADGRANGLRAFFNGKPVNIGETSSFIHDEILDVARLRAENELIIEAATETAGFQIDAASLFVGREK